MITAISTQEIINNLIKQIDNLFGCSDDDKLLIDNVIRRGGGNEEA